jgi:hypothetical protein
MLLRLHKCRLQKRDRKDINKLIINQTMTNDNENNYYINPIINVVSSAISIYAIFFFTAYFLQQIYNFSEFTFKSVEKYVLNGDYRHIFLVIFATFLFVFGLFLAFRIGLFLFNLFHKNLSTTIYFLINEISKLVKQEK